MKLCEIIKIGSIGLVSVLLVIASFFFFWVGGLRGEDTSKYVQELSSKDPAVRMEAARKLGETKDSSAVSPLLDVLRKDKHWDVRGAAEDALVSIGEPAVKPLTALLNDQDWHIRRRAARTLGEIHDPGSDEALVTAMKKDQDCCVREFSAKALGEIRDPRASEILTAALKERNMEVVTGAYRFFIMKGESGTEVILIEVLNQNANKKMIMDFLNSGNPQLGEAALQRAKSCGYSVSQTSDWVGPRWGTM